ncbi:MAG TPA: tripartite tricarboxylate transporter substrate-binding protein [Ramlibacter sp.]|uniref:Bug family tripartite tricarboxylate transporter substrate binding protein n=1 Tax=Ramlibacter sp. TaxID=1917967 RepID=UPI002D7E806D|nr:tripartite tricarboxylate transporter substrate-binding protein [Ramlibacter sp.]HET8746236.1 tripartite tricarboxylate transporter substrate-binding protein [Ramlibacter sp.]
MKRRTALHSLAAGAAVLAAPALRAQDQAPVTILVGAASSMDFTARLLADHLRESLGRPVIVVSKLGAGGRVALNELKRSAPDGRTLMFSTSSPFAIYPHIYTRLDYDPIADFTPIAGVSLFDVGLATGPMTQAGDLKELVGWAKGQAAGTVYGAAPGAGSSSHFVGIALAQATGLPLKPVHYKDSGVGILDVVSGRLPMLITGTSPLATQHKAGKLKLVAVSGEKRSPLVPDVPTFKEQGFDVVIENSAALYGPAKLPRDMVERLHAGVTAMLAKQEALEKMAGQGMAPLPMSGVQLSAWLANERRRYEHLAKASGYVPETL